MGCANIRKAQCPAAVSDRSFIVMQPPFGRGLVSASELAKQCEIAEWQVWTCRTLAEVLEVHIRVLRGEISRDAGAEFAHRVIGAAEPFVSLVGALRDELEYHELLKSYERLIDAARELTR